MTNILFVRDFIAFSGGHLKVFDYLNHTMHSGVATPVLYQTPKSRLVFNNNIFNCYVGRSTTRLEPFSAYFLAGDDWFILDEAGIDTSKSTVINLVQGFRHVLPNSRLLGCLSRPAIRICVSPAVADAIRNHANGEIYVIENGIAVEGITDCYPLHAPPRIMIAGWKNPEVAREVARRLRDHPVDLITDCLPRQEFLARMAAASICVLLPISREGFFLPPLEAMALRRGVVTPECGGNLCYCEPDVNCIMPNYDASALADAVLGLMRDSARLCEMAEAGFGAARKRTIEAERAAYLKILSHHIGPIAGSEP
jgi:hypothetical protein